MTTERTIIINNEIAYEVKEHPNYFVTKSGDVYSIKVIGGNGKVDVTNPRKIKYKVDKDGYFEVCFSENNQHKYLRVHRIVAKQFLPDWDDSLFVNHKDLNKQNNNLTNLEMVTAQENTNHLWATDTGILPACQKDVHVVDTFTGKLYKFTTQKACRTKFPQLTQRYITEIEKGTGITSGNKAKTIHILHDETSQTFKAFKNGKIVVETQTLEDMADALHYSNYKHDRAVKSRFESKINSPKTLHCMQYHVFFPTERSIDYRKQLKVQQRKLYRDYKLSE